MSTTDLKNTPLVDEHRKLNATMVPFGGWNMPVQYSTVIDEHMATRKKAGIFDISHMGEFLVSGDKAEAFLQKMVTNDISRLGVKQACYNCLCRENGTVIDDLFVYRLGESEYFVVVNGATIDKDFAWLAEHRMPGVQLKNISDTIAKIDIQGPRSEEVLQQLTEFDLENIKRFHSEYVDMEGVGDKVLVSRTGYTGEDGFETYFHPKHAPFVWNALLEKGKSVGVLPCGLGARDTLRIEACYSLYGHELSERITPIEAGLGFVVKFTKDFIGKETLERQKAEGTKRKLICFEMVDKAVPRENYQIMIDNNKVGIVSSGTFSPLFRKGIGMGFITPKQSDVGNEIYISVRGKAYKARIVQRPIYKYRGGT